MTAFIAAALIWGLALSNFLRGRLGPLVKAWPRSIALALGRAKPRLYLGGTAS